MCKFFNIFVSILVSKAVKVAALKRKTMNKKRMSRKTWRAQQNMSKN